MKITTVAMTGQASSSPKQAKAGRVFKISFKGIPTMDAKAKARLEIAARRRSDKACYPTLIEA